MAWAYYNENDPEKVAALKALMAAGFIAPGEIDDRDIRNVAPIELSRFTQCHFFAGIGLWSVAARAAGIPDDTRFWSGSAPCQPFSAAGAGEGVADPRHLWPHWFWLIAQQRPPRVVGEQVSSKDGLAWIELVSADMEGAAYAGGSLDLCSASVGAPNIRQRLYMCWLADELGEGCDGGAGLRDSGSGGNGQPEPADCGSSGGLDNLIGDGRGARRDGDHQGDERIEPDADGAARGMGDAPSSGPQGRSQRGTGGRNEGRGPRDAGLAGSSGAGELGHPERAGLERQRGHGDRATGREPGEAGSTAAPSDASGLGDADRASPGDRGLQPGGEFRGLGGDQGSGLADDPHGRGDAVPHSVPAPTSGFWARTDWLLCRDTDGPKLRPVRPGSFCLATGNPGRAGELRAYGDAINVEVATAFLEIVKPDWRL